MCFGLVLDCLPIHVIGVDLSGISTYLLEVPIWQVHLCVVHSP